MSTTFNLDCGATVTFLSYDEYMKKSESSIAIMFELSIPVWAYVEKDWVSLDSIKAAAKQLLDVQSQLREFFPDSGMMTLIGIAQQVYQCGDICLVLPPDFFIGKKEEWVETVERFVAIIEVFVDLIWDNNQSS